MSRARGKSLRYRKRYRRRRLGALFVLAGLLVAGAAAFESVRALEETAAPDEGLSPGGEVARMDAPPAADPPGAPAPAKLPPASAAYLAVAAELPGIEPEGVRHIRQSVLDPSWASARIEAPGRPSGHFYALFLHREGKRWEAERSVLIEDQPHPKDVKALLSDLPEDLVNPLFPEKEPAENAGEPAARAVQVLERATGREDGWKATGTETVGEYHRVRVEREQDGQTGTHVYLREEGDNLKVVAVGQSLTTAEAPGFPKKLAKPAPAPSPETADFDPTEPVLEGDLDRERVGKGLAQAREAVEDYPGVAGFYAIDLKSGGGYGVRPDEIFFSASTIKIPVMVAVYRRIDQ
ncbi:MAG: serine hydrolase, partial [Actinomycetota bacterium]